MNISSAVGKEIDIVLKNNSARWAEIYYIYSQNNKSIRIMLYYFVLHQFLYDSTFNTKTLPTAKYIM